MNTLYNQLFLENSVLSSENKLPLVGLTCQQIEFFSCMSAFCVSQGQLYIGPDIIFGIFSDVHLPLLPLSLADLHEGRGSLALA